MNPIDRRDFGAVALGAAAATLLHGRHADAQPRRPDAGSPPVTHAAQVASPAEAAIAPLPFAPASLPGLSERMLVSHHDNNYGGAVRKLNEVRAQLAGADPTQSGPYWSLYGSLKAAELAARNSAVLHEMYFANLAAGQTPPPALATRLAQRFGSIDRLRAQMLGASKAANGWVVLVADGASHTLEIVQTENHSMGGWSASPLLVLDVYEHAFAIDYGANKAGYFDAFWRNVGWNAVHDRASRALARR
jgi:superoxide dismutase, Fe-Mn family